MSLKNILSFATSALLFFSCAKTKEQLDFHTDLQEEVTAPQLQPADTYIPTPSLHTTQPLVQKTQEPCPSVTVTNNPSSQFLSAATLETKIKDVNVLSLSLISRKEDESVADTRQKYATKNEEIILYAVVKAQTPEGIVYFTQAPSVRLEHAIQKEKVRQWNFEKDLFFMWKKVEWDGKGWYVHSPGAPCPHQNETCRDISYVETLLPSHAWSIKADAHPTTIPDQFTTTPTGLGTMRYALSLNYNGKELSTAGKEAMQKQHRKVHRISFREDTNSFADYAFELINLPYIWGSSQSSVDNLLGVDCADLAVYVRRRTGHNQEYTWTGGLPSRMQKVETISSHDGTFYRNEQGEKITSTKLRKGDVILYPRHAALYLEDNGDGFFGKRDGMIHTMFHQPEVTQIRFGNGTPLGVYTWKKK